MKPIRHITLYGNNSSSSHSIWRKDFEEARPGGPCYAMLLFGCMLWLGIGVVGGASTVQAQQPASDNVELPIGVVMPDTIGVIKLDLTVIDPKVLFSLLPNQTDDTGLATVEMTAQASLNTLIDAGVTNLYATIPAEVIPHGAVCLVIPCDDVETVAMYFQGLTAMIPPPLKFVVLKQAEQVIVCPEVIRPKFEQLVASQQKVNREDLSLGFQAVSKFPHQALFSLPKDLQATLGRVFPERLSSELPTDFSPSRWVKNVNTLAIGWSLPPNVDLQVHMLSPDGASAEIALAETMKLVKLVPNLGDAVKAETEDGQVALTVQPDALVGFLTSALDAQRQAAQRMQTSNNLKQIVMAMHHYYDAYDHFVPAAIRDASGKSLLSWRVSILPYIGQQELYDQFKLDEPWDSEHNKPLLAKMPQSFADPWGEPLPEGMTNYRLPVIAGSVWSTEEPLRFKDVTDGTSSTIWVVRAPKSAAVEWTNPEPWKLDESSLKTSIFGEAPLAIVGYIDGSIRTIQATNSEENLKYTLQYADGTIPQLE